MSSDWSVTLSNQDRRETLIPNFLPQQLNTWGLSTQDPNHKENLSSLKNTNKKAIEAAHQDHFWFG